MRPHPPRDVHEERTAYTLLVGGGLRVEVGGDARNGPAQALTNESDLVRHIPAVLECDLDRGGGLTHASVHALDGGRGIQRNGSGDDGLLALVKSGGKILAGIGSVGRGLEQAGQHILLRGETETARVRESSAAASDKENDEQCDEDLEARVTALAAHLGLDAVLLDHLLLGEREETGIGWIGHEAAGLAERVERVDVGAVRIRGRDHGRRGG